MRGEARGTSLPIAGFCLSYTALDNMDMHGLASPRITGESGGIEGNDYDEDGTLQARAGRQVRTFVAPT